MPTPEAEARRVTFRLVVEIVRTSQRYYFSDLHFPDAVCAVLLAGEIIAAEASGQRISQARLGENIDMPRSTVGRKLGYLRRKGLVTREPDGLHFDSARLDPGSIRDMAKLITDTAADLSTMDIW